MNRYKTAVSACPCLLSVWIPLKSFLEECRKSEKAVLTFAPEAGTQRLRDVINKGVTEEDLINTVTDALSSGWSSIKLYFMIGLPTETEEDLQGIADMSRLVRKIYYSMDREKCPKNLKVTVSTSSFVPKPFTPFQWVPQDTMDKLGEKQDFLRNAIRGKEVTYNWNDPEASFRKLCLPGRPAWQNYLIRLEKGCKV